MRHVLLLLLIVALPALAEETTPPEADRAPWYTELAPLPPVEPVQVEGRFVTTEGRFSVILPPAWRADDVRITEIGGAEARELLPDVEAIVRFDYLPRSGQPETLLTIYRLPLAHWRQLEKDAKATFGRITASTPSTAYVVLRPDTRRARGRHAKLRMLTEQVVGSLAAIDIKRETAAELRPQIARKYRGELANGRPVELELADDGTMNLKIGREGEAKRGWWKLLGTEVTAQVPYDSSRAHQPIRMRVEGDALQVIGWEERTHGPVGAVLYPAD